MLRAALRCAHLFGVMCDFVKDINDLRSANRVTDVAELNLTNRCSGFE